MYFVYITTKNHDEALNIGRDLVSRRLAACINIIDKMHSLYWWNGEIQEDDETILIAKTTKDNIDALTNRVKVLHSYSCPCIVAFPIDNGNKDYLEWIQKETHKL